MFSSGLPDLIARYAGDVLWGIMVVWLVALSWPRATTRRLGAAALLIAFVVELSQLYRAPWIDALRTHRIGALALGQGFLWSDLLCYAAGVGVAALLDWWLVQRSATASH